MTDPIEITQVVLLRLGELLRKLPPELVRELYEGTATLEIRSKSGRTTKTSAKPAVTANAEQVEADLARIDDRAAAVRYLADLGLTVQGLRSLARELKITVPSKARKDDIIQEIVKWTVSKRLRTDAI